MFAALTDSAFGACYFSIHEPHFLKSGTNSLYLISKYMNLNKVAILQRQPRKIRFEKAPESNHTFYEFVIYRNVQ